MDLNSQISERYKTVRILGSGSSGTVYLAHDRYSGSTCSIKCIKLDNGMHNASRLEYALLRKLDHPAIPKAFDRIECHDTVYLISEYFEGVTLDTLISGERRPSEKEAVLWALQLCGIFRYLHSITPYPVVYRDLKPSNILLAKDDMIKLIDFGAACEYRKESRHDTVPLGTKGFAAPEQYYGGCCSPASDIYCLGITLNTLLTGEYPSCEGLPASYISDDRTVSEGMRAIIKKCTMQDPESRYSSVEEVSRAFQNLTGYGYESSVKGMNIAEPVLKLRENESETVKKVVSVFDNACFALELSHIMANDMGLKVFLADLDLFAPNIDLLANIHIRQTGMSGVSAMPGESALYQVIEALSRENNRPDIIEYCCAKKRHSDSLYILTGNHSLDDYEYYNDKMVVKLIEHASRSFDVSVLSVGRFIYDSFNIISLMKADVIFIPLKADLCTLREYCRYIGFIEEKQGIAFDKSRFVAFEYDASTDLDTSAIDELTGGRLAGVVRYDRHRCLSRSNGAYVADGMGKQTVKEYAELLKDIGIKTKRKDRNICR